MLLYCGSFMLNVINKPYCAECHYADCRYADCRWAERHYADCRYTERLNTECCYAECHYVMRRSAVNRSSFKTKLGNLHQKFLWNWLNYHGHMQLSNTFWSNVWCHLIEVNFLRKFIKTTIPASNIWSNFSRNWTHDAEIF